VVDSMKRLTLEQYRKMVEKVIEFKKLNGEMPEYTVVEGCKIGRDNYIDMIERVNKFLLEMGRNPGTVDIEIIDKTGYENEYKEFEKVLI
jgi:hypothetical protein